tara:strand:- start:17431 stop:17874 length:444 start_codon:yes stop_codon:yes gene_type:complete
MNMTRKILFVVLLQGIVGCAVNRQGAEIINEADLSQAKVFYVEHFEPDRRNFQLQISDEINKKGYSATAGEPGNAPDETDVVVTYKDKWMWDITNYMISLTVTFREPVTNYPLAVGESYHTSLTRLSPEKMIAEVLKNLFLEIESPE